MKRIVEDMECVGGWIVPPEKCENDVICQSLVSWWLCESFILFSGGMVSVSWHAQLIRSELAKQNQSGSVTEEHSSCPQVLLWASLEKCELSRQALPWTLGHSDRQETHLVSQNQSSDNKLVFRWWLSSKLVLHTSCIVGGIVTQRQGPGGWYSGIVTRSWPVTQHVGPSSDNMLPSFYTSKLLCRQ